MNNVYIAVTIEENNKLFAYTLKVNENENLVSVMKIKGLKFANVFKTKCKADKVAEDWNNSYIKNGNYMFKCS